MAKEAADEIGVTIEEGFANGGSDGNFTASIGILTLDGRGCPGDGAHAEHEHIIIDEIPKRAVLIFHLF